MYQFREYAAAGGFASRDPRQVDRTVHPDGIGVRGWQVAGGGGADGAMHRRSVCLAGSQEARGLFLLPFRNRQTSRELFQPWCSPAVGFRDVVAGSPLSAHDRTRDKTRNHVFDWRKRRQDLETLAGERAHDIVENARSGQRVHDRMMKRQDDRRAIGCPQDRCSHQWTRKCIEGQN